MTGYPFLLIPWGEGEDRADCHVVYSKEEEARVRAKVEAHLGVPLSFHRIPFVSFGETPEQCGGRLLKAVEYVERRSRTCCSLRVDGKREVVESHDLPWICAQAERAAMRMILGKGRVKVIISLRSSSTEHLQRVIPFDAVVTVEEQVQARQTVRDAFRQLVPSPIPGVLRFSLRVVTPSR